MANYTLIGGDEKQYGPVTDEQLRQWIRDGRVTPQSQLKAEGDAEWRPISQFPEFADIFGGGPAGSTQFAVPSLQTRLLKSRLRLLVCLEALFVICTIVMSAFADSLLPAQLQAYEASVSKAPHTLIDWIGFALYIVLLPTALTATIGLLLSRKPARPLFLWTRITVVAITPLQGTNVEPGWAALFDAAAVLAAGVIIGMLYYSQLKEFYDKPKSAA
ncbi:MAG: DUF4339 domain-containing protein [Verrucomicrobiota bacterium]|jgi:hypothetical protein